MFLVIGSSILIAGSSLDGATKNKFREREATDDSLSYPNLDEDSLLNSKCPHNIELRWQTVVSSSIYGTPLIADINNDGRLEVVVPSFVHYLEVLEGDKIPGFPAFHQSYVHSSFLLFGIDKDGVREIALPTYNGEVLFFRVSGYMMSEKLVVHRRKVHKDWYVGLDPETVDRSHPDVHDDSLVKQHNNTKSSSSSSTVSNASVTSTTEGNHVAVNSSTVNEGKKNITQLGGKIELPKMDNTNSSVGSENNSKADRWHNTISEMPT